MAAQMSRYEARQAVRFISCSIKRVSEIYSEQLAKSILQLVDIDGKMHYKLYLNEFKETNVKKAAPSLKASWDSFIAQSISEKAIEEDHFVWFYVGVSEDIEPMREKI